jgi:glutathione S-transferase/RNA polymerase-associated protein
MVTLLNVPISPFGLKVKMAMLEKGIAFETREPDLEAAQAGRDPELTPASSPRLEIPLLIDGDVAIFDSTIILEYLEDRWPEPPLLPEAPGDRARVRMLEDVCDTTYEAVVWGIYEVMMMGRVSGEAQERLLAHGRRQADGLNAWLDRALGGRTWMNGARFGWGDVSVFPPVNNADRLGVPPASADLLAERVASALQEARMRPEGANESELTRRVCAGIVFRSLPCTGSQRRIMPSFPPTKIT